MKSSSKKLQKAKREQESNFVQNWSPHEHKPQYDALEDPHAKYYFFNKSLNQHLKGLKKAIKEEPNAKQRKLLRQKIDSKLSVKLPALKQATPKSIIYQHQISRSEKQIKLQRQKRSYNNTSAHQTSGALLENSRYRKGSRYVLLNDSLNEKPTTSERSNGGDSEKPLTGKPRVDSLDEKNVVSHQRFLQFLAKKKSYLNSSAENGGRDTSKGAANETANGATDEAASGSEIKKESENKRSSTVVETRKQEEVERLGDQDEQHR